MPSRPVRDLVPRGRPLTVADALALGLTRDQLRGPSFIRPFHGVYLRSDTFVDEAMLVRAALLVLPTDACASHLTALHLHGVLVGPTTPLHFSTNSSQQSRQRDVVLHRRRGTLHPLPIDGIPVLGPDRTFVDCSTVLGRADLVRAGDWLVRLGLTSPEQLSGYAHERHLDGVARARMTTPHVRAGAESVPETDVRLVMRAAHLPEPELNADILDDLGHFLARGDLVYRRYKVVVEYDGLHHERDAAQRQRDILRRERLEAHGWRVVVLTAADLRNPTRLAHRVHDALAQRGFTGPRPRTVRAPWSV